MIFLFYFPVKYFAQVCNPISFDQKLPSEVYEELNSEYKKAFDPSLQKSIAETNRKYYALSVR
ncbi:hypothetical protein AGMMS49949_03190 [Alphaproteobacteria bacterium]|nr:hypothetical protein AGMMS49949_03190 [Alphaproteobacteria bacterium]GHS97361.1 hypothetical protein AGMMS50296_4280 [Alphaproteobacteria bacterium]